MAELIVGRGSERDPAALRLYTTGNRNYVDNERPDEELPVETLRAALRIVQKISPTAKCRSLTAMYNCVGLVFASRRTTIDCRHLEMILRDDGYRRVAEGEVVEGDIVVYRRNAVPQHVGFVYQLEDVSIQHDRSRIELWILSQWGESGEYLHRVREVPPIYGNEIEFLTERRPVQ